MLDRSLPVRRSLCYKLGACAPATTALGRIAASVVPLDRSLCNASQLHSKIGRGSAVCCAVTSALQLRIDHRCVFASGEQWLPLCSSRGCCSALLLCTLSVSDPRAVQRSEAASIVHRMLAVRSSLILLARCSFVRRSAGDPLCPPLCSSAMSTSEHVSALLQQLVHTILPPGAPSEERSQQASYLSDLAHRLLKGGPRTHVDTIDERSVMRHAEKESQTQHTADAVQRPSQPCDKAARALLSSLRLVALCVCSRSSHRWPRWHSSGSSVPAAAS